MSNPGRERPPALLFGGTFDPPHRTHVAVARMAADQLGARAILVVPAARNPLRPDHDAAPPEDRLAMARLAFADEPRARVLDLELRRPAPSYTIDTLRALVEAGEEPLRLLIGSDQAVALPSWRAWRDVVALAPPAIVLRPPHDAASLGRAFEAIYGDEAPSWCARVLPIPPVDMRATELRRRLRRGDARSPDDFPELDPRVLDHIRGRLLYLSG
jgi:nicotinate-nucleotide adenylyltransferase